MYNYFKSYLQLFCNKTKNNTINILNIFLQYLKDNISRNDLVNIDTDSFKKKYDYLGPIIKISTEITKKVNYTILILDKSYRYDTSQQLYYFFKKYTEDYIKLNNIDNA